MLGARKQLNRELANNSWPRRTTQMLLRFSRFHDVLQMKCVPVRTSPRVFLGTW